MSPYHLQLTFGLVALAAWGATAFRWFGLDHKATPVQLFMVFVGFAAALIILPFGSLRLLGVIDDTLWGITGSLLRFVVASSGIVALIGGDR